MGLTMARDSGDLAVHLSGMDKGRQAPIGTSTERAAGSQQLANPPIPIQSPSRSTTKPLNDMRAVPYLLFNALRTPRPG